MSLKEDIKGNLPENVYSVKVDRKAIHGSPMINVIVYYTDPAGKSWFLDINFAEKNKMTAEAMAANIASRLKFETAEV